MRIIFTALLISYYFLSTSQQLEVEGDIDVLGNKVTNVADPTLNQDVATKAYVDKTFNEKQLNAGLFWIPGRY